MQYDPDAWTLVLPAGTPPPPDPAPMLGSGRVGIVPTIESAGAAGLDASRCLLAARQPGLIDAPRHIRVRVTPPAESAPSPVTLVTSPQGGRVPLSIDMRASTLYAPYDAIDAHGSVWCSVDHRLCVLRNMPSFTMHSITLTVHAAGCQEGACVDHEVEVGACTGTGTGTGAADEPTFASAVIGGAYMVTARSAATHLVAYYMWDDPPLADNLGLNAVDGRGCFNRFRLHAPAGNPTSPHTYTLHVLTGVLHESDHPHPDAHLREAVLRTIGAAGPDAPAADVATTIYTAHKSAWARLWESNIEVAPKAGLNAAGQSKVARVAASLRCAVFALHNACRPSSGVVVDSLIGGGRLMGSWACNRDPTTEGWLIRAMMALQADAGRAVLDTRRLMLDSARATAESIGLSGAVFSQAPASGGLRWRASEPPRILSTATVAVLAWDYFRMTYDVEWLRATGYPILREVADALTTLAQPASDHALTGAWHLPAVTGADESGACPLGPDNAASVTAAVLALRGALEACYQLGYAPRDDWRSAYSGLMVPLMPAPDSAVLRLNSGVAAGDPDCVRVGVMETLLPLTTAFNDALFILPNASGVSYFAALTDGLAFWTNRTLPAFATHPVNMLLRMHVMGLLMQVAPTLCTPASFEDLLVSFLDTHTNGWGSLSAGAGRGGDVGLAAGMLLAVAQSVGGLRITGGVGEGQTYYEAMGISASTQAVMPDTWQRLMLHGVGGSRRDFPIINSVLLPSHAEALAAAAAGGMIAPFSVDTLL